jgi:5-methylcytosine-specific restriction endonuclease McrA
VQHGGSSSLLNLVGLCGQCHARVHPWLPQTVRRRGWVHVRELIVPFMDWLERRFSRSA